MIALELVYQNDIVKVEESKTNGFIQFIWLQQPNSKELRREIRLMADYIVQHEYNNVLSDVRQRLFLDICDQNWLHHEIFPIYNQINNFKFAYLVNSLNLEMLDIYRIQDGIQSNPDVFQHLEIEIFMNKEDALTWLLSDI